MPGSGRFLYVDGLGESRLHNDIHPPIWEISGQSIGLWVASPVYPPPLGMTGNEYHYEFTLTGLSPHQAVAVEPISWGTMKSLYR